MKFLSALFVLVSFSLLATPASAWVKSMSLERSYVGENIRVLEVSVKCKLDKSERKLRRVVSANEPWCSVDVPSMCSQRKVTVAREMCQFARAEFKALIDGKDSQEVVKTQASDEPNQVVSPSRDDLIQEQLLIEEQRIKIAQLQIELSRKELVLRKSLSES